MASTGSALEEKQSMLTLLSTLGTVEDAGTGGSTSGVQGEPGKTPDKGTEPSRLALLSTLGIVEDFNNGGSTSVVENEGEKTLGTGAASSREKQKESTAVVDDEEEKGRGLAPASALKKVKEVQNCEIVDLLSSDEAKPESEVAANITGAPEPPLSGLRRSTPVRQTSAPGAYSMEAGRAQLLQPSSSVRSLGIASDTSLSGDESVPLHPPQENNRTSPEEVVLEGSLVLDISADDQVSPGRATVSRAPSSSHFSVDSMELIDGKVVDNTNTPKPKQARPSARIVLLLSGVLILGMASALATYFGLSRGSKSEEPSGSNSEATSLLLYAPFENDTIPIVIANAIQDVGSPQYRANIWMLQDPHRETYSMDRQWQRFYMVTLYYTSNGDTWLRNDGWLSYEMSECEWFNQDSSGNLGYESIQPITEVCNQDNELLALNLTANNLTGHMQGITHFMVTLKRFDISKNDLEGLLPVQSYQPSMEVYDVSDNGFDGLLVGSFTSFDIKFIKTAGNALFGYTPGLWQLLDYLEHMDCSNNFYNSPLVTQMGLCRELRTLDLSNNLYYGNIPSELGSLPYLRNYNISGNHDVSGTIPSEFGLLSTLEMMDLSGTQVSGDIPEPLCKKYLEGSLDIFADCSRLSCCE